MSKTSSFCLHCLCLFHCLAFVIVFMSVSSHAIRVELKRELVVVRESFTQAGGAREELGVIMSRATWELEVTLDPNASSAEHLIAMMAAGWKWILWGVRFGVHTAFWVLSTHNELDLALVSAHGAYKDFTEEDLQLVHEETRAFAETLTI